MSAIYDKDADRITITIDNVKARIKAAAPTSKGNNMLLANINGTCDVVDEKVAGSTVRVMCNAIFATPEQAAAKANTGQGGGNGQRSAAGGRR